MNRSEKMLTWLEKEKEKDKIELERSKLKLINEIKKEKDILPKPKKLTLWQRVRKVLIGY